MMGRKGVWLGAVLGLVFLGIFLLRTDISGLSEAFAGANYRLAIASVPLYFAGYWLRAMRWRFVLRPIRDVPTPRLYPALLISLMANNLAPARIGEVVRAYLVGEQERLPKSTVLGTIAVDRTFDGLALVGILGVATAFAGAHDSVRLTGIATALLFAGIVLAMAVLSFSTFARALLRRTLALLPGPIGAKLDAFVESFLDGLAAIRSPGALTAAILLSVASWLVEGAMFYVVGLAFDLNLGIEVYLLVLAAANLAGALVALPGGVGPFEAASQSILISFNVASNTATAYTLLVHALLLLPVIVIGLILLWSTQLSLGEMFARSKRVPAGVVVQGGTVE